MNGIAFPKVRLSDVAKEAGVSLATVDRVVNARAGVRSDTVSRVREAYDRLMEIPSGAAGRKPGQRRLRIDFVLPSGDNTYIETLAETVAEAETLRNFGPNARLRCHRCDGLDPPALAEALRRVAADSDGIAVIALEHPAVREAVGEVAGRGVPVVTIASDISHSKRFGYVGVDNRAAGRTAGYLMGRFVGKRGKVAMIAGSLSYRGHEEREMGFRAVLRAGFPNLEIVALLEGRDDPAASAAETAALIDRHPDLAGLYSIGGGSRGVAEALTRKGRAGEIVFIGHELTRHTRRFLIAG
ncbi:MAG TPA: LacI family DNA-binding transcriptional regulator, partial [Alphaproteobacteria bacterium]|nr:LacI family DNA-binding transcriptional regulator [Alphaproteobacteria bacterium]